MGGAGPVHGPVEPEGVQFVLGDVQPVAAGDGPQAVPGLVAEGAAQPGDQVAQ